MSVKKRAKRGVPEAEVFEAIWLQRVQRVLLNPQPADVAVEMKEAGKKQPMPPKIAAALVRDRLPVQGNGLDRWAAQMVAAIFEARKHREGVADGRLKESKEADARAVIAGSEIALTAVQALASWNPEFFEGIARWMRICSQKSTPNWATVVAEVRKALEAAGLQVTKAQLRTSAIQRMQDVTGRVIVLSEGRKGAAVGRLSSGAQTLHEPTNWAGVFKEAGCSDVLADKPGPAKGAENAGRPRKGFREGKSSVKRRS